MQLTWKNPGDWGLATLNITRILWESGRPDAESHAWRRNGVLRGFVEKDLVMGKSGADWPRLMHQPDTNIAENVAYLGRTSGLSPEALGS